MLMIIMIMIMIRMPNMVSHKSISKETKKQANELWKGECSMSS